MRVLAILAVVVVIAAAALSALWWRHLQAEQERVGAEWKQRWQEDTKVLAAEMAELRATSTPPASPPLPAPVAAALVADVPIIAWTAHAGARLEPCGCVAGMHGGLARRATLLGRVPAERVLALECGGWSGGQADYQIAKAEWFLRALAASGCDAVGIGTAEVALGHAHLTRLAQAATTAKVPLVCANVVAADGAALVPTHLRVLVGGQAYVITAVAPANASGIGLAVGDPAEALLKLRAATGDARVIVLADLDAAALADLARAVPGLALVVGGAVDQPSAAPLAVGGCRVVHVANEGKTLGWWPWAAETCAFELITDDIGDHPAVRALIGDYQEALGALDLALDGGGHGLTALDAGVSAARYVGDATCLACHAGAHAVHAASRHAHAFATLAAKNYHRDPECLRCHVTGLGAADGYQRRAPSDHAARVACEACHGRGSQHVAERGAGRPASGTLTPVTPATCVRCHDHENSPRFDYAAYWEKIRHDRR